MRKRHPKMKKSNLVFLSICVSFCFNPFVLAQNAAVVNGKPIPLAKLTRMLEKSGQMNSPDVKEKARDVLITKELILQEADKRGLERIVVIPPEGEGLAIAIRDRLTRAAR